MVALKVRIGGSESPGIITTTLVYHNNTMYPDAEKIILVMDNLNMHKPASLYKRYPAEEARRILKKLEIHDTPKHGSWLDITEIELNVMTRQCLNRRIAEIGLLRSELSA